MHSELLDLVNKNDEVIGTIDRLDYERMLADNLGYIRASDLFILNSDGKIFVPIRTADKHHAPNGFDYSVGGHVSAGEDYLTAIIREAEEELNIVLAPDDIECIGKDISDKSRYIRSIYLVRSDETPQYNPSDFKSAQWMYPADLVSAIDKGHPTKSSLKSVSYTHLTLPTNREV